VGRSLPGGLASIIDAVYFPLHGGIVATGRPPQPDQFKEAFLRQAPMPNTVLRCDKNRHTCTRCRDDYTQTLGGRHQ